MRSWCSCSPAASGSSCAGGGRRGGRPAPQFRRGAFWARRGRPRRGGTGRPWDSPPGPRLAYVITGDAEVDRISKAGLQGLTLFLAQRTALEAGEPIGLDPARDELAFYPLIYWPLVPSAAKPSREGLEHLDAYMKQGGTGLFDTRDAVEAPAGAGGETRGPGMQALRAILSSLDIPELEPVRRDHVLTKTFYLLKDFPGRFASGQLWVEALPAVNEDEP